MVTPENWQTVIGWWLKKVAIFFQKKIGATPSVAAPGDTHPSDATGNSAVGHSPYSGTREREREREHGNIREHLVPVPVIYALHLWTKIFPVTDFASLSFKEISLIITLKYSYTIQTG